MFVFVVVVNGYSFNESISRQIYWLEFSYEIGSHHLGTVSKSSIELFRARV